MHPRAPIARLTILRSHNSTGPAAAEIVTTGSFLEDYRPATFLERGVSVPFTTPLLASARVRPSRRGAPEFMIANPSGGAGYYIMPWQGLMNLTKVTVHDRLLYDETSKQPMLTPSSMREAARLVALGGAAGRPAAKAAQAAVQRDSDDRLIANYLLLVSLLRQAGVKEGDWRNIDPSDPTLRTRMRANIERLSPSLGVKAETILEWIEDLSGIVAPVGLPGGEYQSRQQLALEGVRKLQRSLVTFANADPSEAAQAALFIHSVATLTVDLAAQALDACYAELKDLNHLLRNWTGNRQRLLEIFGRPDWLLDGWATICGIWVGAESAGRDAQRDAIGELERLLPVMPKEVAEWTGARTELEMAGVGGQRRWVRANVDWRTGAHVIDRTARNEAIRAYAA